MLKPQYASVSHFVSRVMRVYILFLVVALSAACQNGTTTPQAASIEAELMADRGLYIRYNHLGYTPERPKKIIVMADESQSGTEWRLTDGSGVVLSGMLGSSIAGKSSHTPMAFNYVVDLSHLTQTGNYKLQVGDSKWVDITVAKRPYEFMVSDILHHFRVQRSGTDDTALHQASHLGDARAIVYRPDGDVNDGRWKPNSQNKTVDMLGGWYDAGDYIKFTLTIAYSTYYLLRAYQTKPEIFSKHHSSTALVDILDEAHHGLEYLLKTHPEKDEFIIQVSTGDDHKQGFRLPEHDKRDGKREALSALSPAQMGLASAALALGADIFRNKGEPEKAQRYREKAIAIYERARQQDALPVTAFERDQTNDFYKDAVPADNMGLAAIELYLLTNQEKYLSEAKEYADSAGNGGWAAWCCVTTGLNYRLSPYSISASANFDSELQGYADYDKNQGNVWGIPMQQYWAPLQGAFTVAAYAGLKHISQPQSADDLLWSNLDYFLGRNNWGVAFIASPKVPYSVSRMYSQVYKLTGSYPLGAIAEGPGDRKIYERLAHFFETQEGDEYYKRFNTEQEVFFHNSSNFQTMETTITLQASALYMLAVAAKLESLN